MQKLATVLIPMVIVTLATVSWASAQTEFKAKMCGYTLATSAPPGAVDTSTESKTAYIEFQVWKFKEGMLSIECNGTYDGSPFAGNESERTILGASGMSRFKKDPQFSATPGETTTEGHLIRTQYKGVSKNGLFRYRQMFYGSRFIRIELNATTEAEMAVMEKLADTLKINGSHAYIPNAAAQPSPPVYSGTIKGKLIYTFDHKISDADLATCLDKVLEYMRADPGSEIYIVIRNAENGDPAEPGIEIARAIKYLTQTRGVDPARVKGFVGKPATKLWHEFWVVPAGAGRPGP